MISMAENQEVEECQTEQLVAIQPHEKELSICMKINRVLSLRVIFVDRIRSNSADRKSRVSSL